MTATTAKRVRELNDAFRTTGPAAGHWMTTPGVREQGFDFVLLVMQAIRSFEDFNPNNDPYGEHDFGSLNIAGHSLFWKIDYYDLSLEYGSNDPADPSITRRVLTIMLTSEY